MGLFDAYVPEAKTKGRPKGGASHPAGASANQVIKQQRKAAKEKLEAILHPKPGTIFETRFKKNKGYLTPAELEKEFRNKFLTEGLPVRKCWLIQDWRWEEYDQDLIYQPY